MSLYWWAMRTIFAGLDWCVDRLNELIPYEEIGDWADWDDEDPLYEERCS
jgi:hypothetical protein